LIAQGQKKLGGHHYRPADNCGLLNKVKVRLMRWGDQHGRKAQDMRASREADARKVDLRR